MNPSKLKEGNNTVKKRNQWTKKLTESISNAETDRHSSSNTDKEKGREIQITSIRKERQDQTSP